MLYLLLVTAFALATSRAFASASTRIDPPARLIGRAAAAFRRGERTSAAPYVMEEEQVHYLKPSPYEMHTVTWIGKWNVHVDQQWAGVDQSFGMDQHGGWSDFDGVVVPLSRGTAQANHALSCWRDIVVESAASPSAFARSVGWRRLPDGTRAQGVALTVPGEAAITVYFDSRHRLPLAVGVRDRSYSRGRMVSILCRVGSYTFGASGVFPGTRAIYRDTELENVAHVVRRLRHTRVPAGIFARPMTSRGVGSADVPIELTGGVPFVRASINGSRPLRFIVDTGAGITALTPLGASAGGIRATGYYGTTLALNARRAALGRAATIQVGGALVHNAAVALGVPGGGSGHGDDYGGLLGFNFLARFQPTLDYPGQHLLLRPIETPTPAGITVPLSVDGGWTYVAAKVFHHDSLFQLDTGTSRTFVRTSDIPPSLVNDRRPIGYTMGPGGRKLSEFRHTAPLLQVGGASGVNIPVYTIKGAEDRAPVLGSRFLSAYQVTLDYQRGQIVLC